MRDAMTSAGVVVLGTKFWAAHALAQGRNGHPDGRRNASGSCRGGRGRAICRRSRSSGRIDTGRASDLPLSDGL